MWVYLVVLETDTTVAPLCISVKAGACEMFTFPRIVGLTVMSCTCCHLLQINQCNICCHNIREMSKMSKSGGQTLIEFNRTCDSSKNTLMMAPFHWSVPVKHDSDYTHFQMQMLHSHFGISYTSPCQINICCEALLFLLVSHSCYLILVAKDNIILWPYFFIYLFFWQLQIWGWKVPEYPCVTV